MTTNTFTQLCCTLLDMNINLVYMNTLSFNLNKLCLTQLELALTLGLTVCLVILLLYYHYYECIIDYHIIFMEINDFSLNTLIIW